MPVYILTGGRHYGEAMEETDGGEPVKVVKVFEKGDRVESDKRLDLMFANKFIKEGDSASGKQVSPQRSRQVKQLIESEDTDWEEDDRSMLEAMSEKRFAQITKDAGLEEEEEETPPAKSGAKGQHPPSKQLAKSRLGEDVSADFKVPEDGSLRVFKNPANKFQVAKKTSPHTPVNDQALEQKDVQAFLDKEGKK